MLAQRVIRLKKGVDHYQARTGDLIRTHDSLWRVVDVKDA